MATRYVLAVHDLNGKRLCTLFDSEIPQMGAAYNIVITKQIASGWKEISFNLSKYDNNGDRNWRWDFIRNENHLYLYEDDSVDKFSIKAPTDLHDSNKVQFTVKANHIAEELKTRNLYGYFDDDNGIGTIAELVHLALAGTGWSLVQCDTLYEKDGVTEKIRSYSCDTKTGAYNMISGLCDLFNAHPVFNGNRTVEIYSNDNTNGYMEILFGKNSNSISRVQNSESLVTRLYVEGEYGNYGYVGIDDVNPTGLPFILNFDYYRDLGLFTNEHQAAVDTYLEDYKDIVDTISGKQSTHNTKNGELITLIGTCAWLRYPVVNGQPDRDSMIEGGVIPDDTDISLQDGDKVAAVKTNGEYEHIEYSTSASSDYSAYAYLIKFYPVILGKIATEEDMESAKQNNIDSLMTSMNKFLRKNDYTQYETVAALKTAYGVADLRIVDDDDFDVSGLPEGLQQTTTRDYAATIGENEAGIMSLQTARYDDMRDAVSLMSQVHTLETEMDNAKSEQAEIEETFVTAMGALLRDGYWSDTNYVPGQEQSLYNDALEISEKVGKPTVTYTISTQDLSVLPEYEGEDFCVGQSVRIYDAETGLNDYAIVSEQKIYPDKLKSNSITLKTDLLDIGTKTFATTIERITELANTLKQNKEKYERAQVISRTGSVPVSVLEGAVDVLTNRLTSVSSNWATDEKGNILLTSLDGTSAMMLCGGGFMVANSKNPDGSWEWRTFGTGDGFTADMITTGFLSADRIQAYTITVDHLSSDVGTSLDLSSNNSIQLIVDDLEGDISQVEQTANKITWIVSSGTSSANMTLTNDFLSATAENIDLSANSTIMTAVENDEGYSQVAQNSNKITWIVQSGSSSSNMELTDDFLAVTAENIDLTANTGFTTTVAGLQSGINSAVNNVDVEYYLSTRTDIPTGGEWSTTAPAWENGKYMWSRIKKTTPSGTTYSDETCIAGAKGDTGTSGRGISTTTVKYQSSSSGTTVPSGTWESSPPSTVAGDYLWTWTHITYTDNTGSDSYAVAYHGGDGAPGTSVTITSKEVKYQSSSSGTTTPTGSWQTSVPSVSQGDFLWTRTIVNYSDGNTTTAYSVARQGENGTNGTNGTDGLNNATVFLYRRSATALTSSDVPSATTTYTFATGILTGITNSWTQAVPTGTNPCYIILASASSTEATDTIASGEWSTPVLWVENGADGEDGDPGTPGYNQATVYLYKRAASASAIPSGTTMRYTFSTNELTNIPTGWSRSIPDIDTDGNPCWVTTAAAYSQDAYYDIPYTAWSSPIRLVKDGADAVSPVLIVEQYYLSTDSYEPEGGEWSYEQPEWENGKYIFIRSEITWDNEEITYTDPVLSKTLNAAMETITTQQTQIVQLQESLSLKAEKTEVTGIEERVTAAEEKITPEAIFSTVSSQLSVGSRNYIKYSRSFIKNDNGDMVTDHNYVMRNINAHVDAAWVDYSNVYESGGDEYSAGSGTKAIENVISPTGEYDEVLQLANASDSLFRIDVMDHSPDSAYCFSIWGKRADTATEDVDVLFSILGHCEMFTMTEEWQRFSVLIEPPYESESIDITTESDEAFFLYKGMLEQGNVVTDWIQAPEDNFESLSSLVEQTDRSWKASINERLGTSGNLSTYMKFTANGLVFGVQTTSGTSSYYSKFQIVINNEAIRFYDFSDYDPKDIPDMSNEAYWQEEEIYKPVAYITSKELYITTASITTGMKVGDYTIMDDGDGGFAIV